MIYILAIESSCDDTSAAVSLDNKICANFIANQTIHENFGGVVPELASRAHQQNIVPVVDQALKQAGILPQQLNAVAFTAGPGLLGSLMVGVSFAKAFALALDIPIIHVDHLQAHILAHFIQPSEVGGQKSEVGSQQSAVSNQPSEAGVQNSQLKTPISSLPTPNSQLSAPRFPFICLTISGGHTQLNLVRDYFDMEIIGETIDDAAGEAFDKAAKILGLTYPGGPLIDEYAKKGNPLKFRFSKPVIKGLDFSFSGLKTSLLYFIRDELKKNPEFIQENLFDICASFQKSIVDILIDKIVSASKQTGIKEIAIAGGVSANSAIRNALKIAASEYKWNIYIPDINYSTDNAAMIAITAYYKYLRKEFSSQSITPYARAR